MPSGLPKILNERRRIPARIVLFLLTILAACSPVKTAPLTPVEETAVPPAETSAALAISPSAEFMDQAEAALPSPTPEPNTISGGQPAQEQVFPYFLALATKPDPLHASQTKDGVTATIDQLYVDEIRVYVGFTVTGLDWPDGTQWDAMKLRISSTAIPDDAYSGAGSWNVTAASASMITGEANVLLWDGGLDAKKTPNINVRLDLPLDGPTSSVNFRFEYRVPVLDGMRIDNIDQTIVANDVSMTLNTVLVQPSYVEVALCFDMPSPVDWMLTASRLTLGDRDYTYSGGGLTEGPRTPAFTLDDAKRCSSIGFDVVYDETPSSLALTVPKLVGSVPEVVNAERVAMANARLSPLGIEIDYVNLDHGGNINVLKRPDGATDAGIYPLIWDALAEQYAGPWVFTVELPK